MHFTSEFIQESLKIIEKIDQNSIDQVINIVSETRDNNGRIFLLEPVEVQQMPLML